jgi:hypothetical protein
MPTQSLTDTANAEMATYQNTFNTIYNDTMSQINSYKSLLDNYNNVNQLNQYYISENNDLNNELIEESHDILTNRRKTFYEDQNISVLGSYYYILLILYVVILIIYAIYIFVLPSPLSLLKKIILLVCLIILPFFSTWILSLIIKIVYNIYHILPKNVYTTL